MWARAQTLPPSHEGSGSETSNTLSYPPVGLPVCHTLNAQFKFNEWQAHPSQSQTQTTPARIASSISRGLGILPGVRQIYAWNSGVLNYWLTVTFHCKYFLLF